MGYTAPIVNGSVDAWGTIINTQTLPEIQADVNSRISKAIGTAAGDILTFSGSGVPSVLHSGAGNNGRVLGVVGGVPSWVVAATGGGGGTPGTSNAPQGWYDITQAPYNAVGDGVVDNTLAIQQAIVDATNAGGALVYIPPGEFLTGPLTVTNTITITGAGRGVSTLKLKNASNDYAITYDGDPDEGIRFAVFSGFTIHGNGANQNSTHNGGGILALGTVENIFSDMVFHECATWGLFLGRMGGDSYGHNSIVNNCLFDNGKDLANYGGGLVTDANDENFIVSCDFQYLGGSRTTWAGDGSDGPHDDTPCAILDTAGLNSFMACNVVNGGNSVCGISIKDNDNATRVFGCNFDGVDGDCMRVVGSRHIIQGNYFSGPSHEGLVPSAGIHVGYGSSYLVVNGNTLITSSNANHSDTLIRVTGDGAPHDNIITNNSLIQGGTPNFGRLYDIAPGTCKVISGNTGIPDTVYNAEQTGDYVISANDRTVVMNGADLTATLPDPGLLSGQTYTIKNSNATPVTIALSGGALDGESSGTLAPYEAVTVVSTGSDWLVTSGHVVTGGTGPVSISANHTIAAGEDVLIAHTGGIIATLPPVAGTAGRTVTLKNVGVATVYLAPALADGTLGNIDGIYSTNTPVFLWGSITVVSDGTQWNVVGSHNPPTEPLEVNANYTVAPGIRAVVANGTSITVNLPSPSEWPLRFISVNDINTTTATVKSPTGGQINGVSGTTGETIAQWETKVYYSDANDWWSLGFAH